jgi:hypothetical protein
VRHSALPPQEWNFTQLELYGLHRVIDGDEQTKARCFVMAQDHDQLD